MSTYRIVCQYSPATCTQRFKVQKKFLWFWLDVNDIIDHDGLSNFYETKWFTYQSDAENWVQSHSPQMETVVKVMKV